MIIKKKAEDRYSEGETCRTKYRYKDRDRGRESDIGKVT